MNGEEVTGRISDKWIIDFGVDMTESEANQYEKPFAYVLENVKPARLASRNEAPKKSWWLHSRPRPAMRTAIQFLHRCIVTPEVAKHRIFIWMDTATIPDHTLHVIAREDDYFFGVLHSRLHELWSLHIGSTLEDRPRYTSTNTFETFPFPFVPGQEDFSDPRVQAISVAAETLDQERNSWLNPPEGATNMQERTLTNLYNALQAERGQGTPKILKASAIAFAPRLNELHKALDLAVVAAYGWDAATLGDDEAILSGLLALNQART